MPEPLTTCRICGKQHDSLEDLSKHLRSDEKIKQATYAVEHVKKLDKWSGEEIPFKNLKQYDETDFLSRENFRKWAVKRASSDEARDYCFDYLRKRSATRGFVYTPSHAELRAINCLSIIGFKAMVDNGVEAYGEFCENDLGLKKRFDYKSPARPQYLDDLKIYVDTREQNPLTFPCTVEIRTLNVGDYSCAEPNYADVVIERKSLEDFVGTMGKGLTRFKKEIVRAQEQNIYLVIVVEEKFDTALNYKDHGKKTKGQTFGMYGASPFGVVRKLMQAYPNIQFLFANDREGSAERIKTIFSLGEDAMKLDLQYKHDIGEL